ncbi:MAG: prepilin-type N-terminal cleavage/methylation domain-containing protein [Candidatus Woesebacteria bacterium]|jgi:prepilin-type N-terminal cleavage/methylation domain-containing protein
MFIVSSMLKIIKKGRKSDKEKHGFTFVELLIVIVIMTTLFGVGYANYRDFARRERLQRAAKKVEGEIQYTKQLALTAKKPVHSNCSGDEILLSYEFDVQGPSQYRISANCSGGDYIEKQEAIGEGIHIENPSGQEIKFRVLGKGSSISEGEVVPIIITSTETDDVIVVDVNSNGDTSAVVPTISPTASPTPSPTPFCTDSDGGSVPSIQGTVQSSDCGSQQDYCNNKGTKVREFYCNPNLTCGQTWIDCSSGCTSGACSAVATNTPTPTNTPIPTNTPAATCTDTDGGFNPDVRGTVTSPGCGTATDFCSSGTAVTEYYCGADPSKCYSLGAVCDTCLNGECITGGAY